MDVTAIATAATLNAQTQLQGAVQLTVLRKAMDLQGAGALQLLQALPTPVAPVGQAVGGNINTYA